MPPSGCQLSQQINVENCELFIWWCDLLVNKKCEKNEKHCSRSIDLRPAFGINFGVFGLLVFANVERYSNCYGLLKQLTYIR